MRENMSENCALQIKLIRKYLKLKILEDNVTFRNHCTERAHVYDLMKRTVSHAESHSAIMIGPRGSGKTTLINSVLHQLSKEVDMSNDAFVVRLNGLIHSDDKTALKAITAQMQLENVVGDRVFGTFAENLDFLFSCIQSSQDGCKSMLFVLDEFDMFCRSGRAQTLLYNLFDITHGRRAPVCVLGITNRLDVLDLLEKRVRSRFSHRHILMFHNQVEGECPQVSPVESYRGVMLEMLSMPVWRAKQKIKGKRKSAAATERMETDQDIHHAIPEDVLIRCKVDPQHFTYLDPLFLEDWNSHVRSLAEDQKVVDAIEKFCYYSMNEQILRNILFQLVSKLGPTKPYIDTADLVRTIDNTVAPEHRVKLLQSLSILELSLVIAMMHGMEIFDGQPMNFEMVLNRYTKFANANSSTQTVPRPVILKAFEHLHSLEIIAPMRGDGSDGAAGKVQREYRLYTLAVPVDDIKEAVKGFKALPTEITHWLNNSVF